MPNQHTLKLFELRCYRARPGRRDELIRMFERHFCPAYEAGGTTILASWTVPEAPDLWIWMRAFAGRRERRTALDHFYGGAVWGRLAGDCRATIADSRLAYLLRAEQVFGCDQPPAREALPLNLSRPWAAAVFPPASAPPSPWTPERTLQLRSATQRVWLQRFDSTAAYEASKRQNGAQAPSTLTHFWHLEPTACSRLR
ncbi:MAG: hypothetical protein U1E77_19695 [Inhella sp.]